MGGVLGFRHARVTAGSFMAIDTTLHRSSHLMHFKSAVVHVTIATSSAWLSVTSKACHTVHLHETRCVRCGIGHVRLQTGSEEGILLND